MYTCHVYICIYLYLYMYIYQAGSTAGWVKRFGDGQPLVTRKAPSTAMCLHSIYTYIYIYR